MSLRDKGAVVTGGGRGIGAAIGRVLAEAGAKVVLAARSVDEIETVAARLRDEGFAVWAVPADLIDPAQIRLLETSAREILGRVDVLINNAGVAASAPLKAISLEEWNRILAINVTAPFLCTQTFMPAMLERGWGRVVNIASIAGKVGHPYIAAYCASKHAVIGFTRAVAAEVASKGVTVNAVCPGYVDTPMTDASVANIAARTGRSETAAREYFEGISPQGRLMEPAEVAYLVASLCDPRAKGINGQAIVLDGGLVQS